MARELTDEEIAAEEKFMEGLPRMNWGAFLMPGIWGPAHGFWVCILFYPLWVFVDNLLFGAFSDPVPWKVAVAVAAGVVLAGVTVAFSLVSQPFAAHRAEDRGISRETYLKRERIWAVACALIAAVFLAWATYYNLEVRGA